MHASLTFQGSLDEMAQLFGQLSTLKLVISPTTDAVDNTATQLKAVDAVATPVIEGKKGPGRPAKVRDTSETSSGKFKEVAQKAVADEPELPLADKPAAAPFTKSNEERSLALRDKMAGMIKDMGPSSVVSTLKEYGVGKLAQLPVASYDAYEAKLDAARAKWEAEKAANDIL